ncbi:hypothetical protein [Kosakonia sacchari]|uniref:hypothetical protein n=1 Tax=Kosakonia sacchari TaxID=1158459 RepID=UPI0012EA3A0C|nr:hypothetical protein [Kosakonia sacchari]MDN2487076.1 hypothetical protein [Kosakonia sacchari]
MAYHYLTHPASPVDGVESYLPGFLAKRQLPFFAKKKWTSANDNDYYCHAFRETVAVILKARHCSHCFQYFLASRVLAFFCPQFTTSFQKSFEKRGRDSAFADALR